MCKCVAHNSDFDGVVFNCVCQLISIQFFLSTIQLHYEKHLDDWRAGPMGLASAQQAFLRTRRNPAGEINPDDPAVPPLEGTGWREELDEATGVYYYVHDESGKRSWVRPNFRPPGPGMMGGESFVVFHFLLFE